MMARKKTIFLLALVVLIAIAILASGNIPPAEAAKTASTEKSYQWRMTGWQVRGTLVGNEMEEFCKLVTEMSGGRLKLMPCFGGEVLSQAEAFNGLRAGICQIGSPWPGFYTGALPEAMIETGLPFSVQNLHEQQIMIKERGWGELLREAYAERNLYWLGDFVQPRPATMFREPIQSLEELKGRKLRAPGGPVANTLAACGGKIVMLPVAELYTALMTGTVDGFTDGHLGMVYDLKLYEFAKYLMDPPLGMLIGPVVVNMKAWNSLPKDLQLILQSAFDTYTIMIDTREGGYCSAKWTEMKTKGCKKCRLPESDRAELRKIADTIWNKAASANSRCTKMVDLLKEYLAELDRLD